MDDNRIDYEDEGNDGNALVGGIYVETYINGVEDFYKITADKCASREVNQALNDMYGSRYDRNNPLNNVVLYGGDIYMRTNDKHIEHRWQKISGRSKAGNDIIYIIAANNYATGSPNTKSTLR